MRSRFRIPEIAAYKQNSWVAPYSALDGPPGSAKNITIDAKPVGTWLIDNYMVRTDASLAIRK